MHTPSPLHPGRRGGTQRSISRYTFRLDSAPAGTPDSAFGALFCLPAELIQRGKRCRSRHYVALSELDTWLAGVSRSDPCNRSTTLEQRFCPPSAEDSGTLGTDSKEINRRAAVRRSRWFYVLIAELISTALAVVIGILSNVLANEKHPERAVIIAIIVLAVSSAVSQTVVRVIEARKSRASDRALTEVRETAQEILDHQLQADRYRDENRIDNVLTQFPAIHRPWIKLLWLEKPSEIEKVLNALSDSTTTPSAVVREWQQRIPVWLSSLGWQALLVAGELANSYDIGQLSIDLLLAAVNAGCTREHYWRARAALMINDRREAPEAIGVLEEGNIGQDSPDQLARIVFNLVSGNKREAQLQVEGWEPQAAIDILIASGIRVGLIFDQTDTGCVFLKGASFLVVSVMRRG
jgi:hypothetical protein